MITRDTLKTIINTLEPARDIKGDDKLELTFHLADSLTEAYNEIDRLRDWTTKDAKST